MEKKKIPEIFLFFTDLHKHPQSNIADFFRKKISHPHLEVREIPSGINQEICKKGCKGGG